MRIVLSSRKSMRPSKKKKDKKTQGEMLACIAEMCCDLTSIFNMG